MGVSVDTDENGSKEGEVADEPVREILRSAMSNLAKQNKDAYDILIRLAEEEFFEIHQSPGSLNRVADALISTVEENGGGNED